MSTSKSFYELSFAAEQDIEEIFDYTEREHGFDQAVNYVACFEEMFEGLLDPKRGKVRVEIKRGLRSLPKAEHVVVFYRVLRDRIRIVRVLHASRDIPTFFDKP